MNKNQQHSVYANSPVVSVSRGVATTLLETGDSVPRARVLWFVT